MQGKLRSSNSDFASNVNVIHINVKKLIRKTLKGRYQSLSRCKNSGELFNVRIQFLIKEKRNCNKPWRKGGELRSTQALQIQQKNCNFVCKLQNCKFRGPYIFIGFCAVRAMRNSMSK